MGIKAGEKIPAKKLAVKSTDPTRLKREKNLAQTLRGFHR